LVLAARSIEEGCRTAGITRQTWYNWVKDEGFANDVYRRRERVISEALDRLKTSVAGAVEGLTGLVHAGEDNVRLRACREVLDYFMKARELEEIERRLAVLERVVLREGKQES
jgi:hypothetical protein